MYPCILVHYPSGPIPDDLLAYERPVEYAVSRTLQPRPNQPVRAASQRLYCVVCYKAHLRHLPVSYDTHSYDCCPLILGDWDGKNPACNPGPYVFDEATAFNRVRDALRRDVRPRRSRDPRAPREPRIPPGYGYDAGLLGEWALPQHQTPRFPPPSRPSPSPRPPR